MATIIRSVACASAVLSGFAKGAALPSIQDDIIQQSQTIMQPTPNTVESLPSQPSVSSIQTSQAFVITPPMGSFDVISSLVSTVLVPSSTTSLTSQLTNTALPQTTTTTTSQTASPIATMTVLQTTSLPTLSSMFTPLASSSTQQPQTPTTTLQATTTLPPLQAIQQAPASSYPSARDLAVAMEENSQPSQQQDTSAYIVGGDVTNAKRWMGSLSYINRYSQYKHYCGVSFINEKWAVTAAHCINSFYIKGDKIRAGGANLNSDDQFSVYSIVDFAVHPQYDPAFSLNDIALLKIDGSHPGPYIKMASQDPSPGTLLTVAGWGYTSPTSHVVSEFLRAVQVPVVGQQACMAAYPNNNIGIGQICAGFEAGGKDSCQGDSGGPLYSGSDLDATIVGVVSYGMGCAQARYYGVYTRVSQYAKWVRSVAVDAPGPVVSIGQFEMM